MIFKFHIANILISILHILRMRMVKTKCQVVIHLWLRLIIDEIVRIFILIYVHLRYSIEVQRNSFWRKISTYNPHWCSLHRRLLIRVRVFFEWNSIRINLISSLLFIFFIDKSLEIRMLWHSNLSKREVSDMNWWSISEVCKGMRSQFCNVDVLRLHGIPNVNVLCFTQGHFILHEKDIEPFGDLNWLIEPKRYGHLLIHLTN